MRPITDEQPVGDGLSNSLLRVIEDAGKIDWLRDILSGFSHRFRNSLNGMKLGLYLCRRESSSALPPVWSDLEQTYELIEKTIDRLQIIYRPMRLTLIESKLGPMIAEREAGWRLNFAERGKILVVERPPSEDSGQLDPMLMGQGLDALVAWRAEVCPTGTKARLSWEGIGERFRIDWREEAPPTGGPPSGEPSRPQHPLSSLRRQVDCLTLPLLARIVLAHGGKLHRGPGSSSALSLHLHWPKSPPEATQVPGLNGFEPRSVGGCAPQGPRPGPLG